MRLAPRRWILLPVGHNTREFEGKALFAFEAAQRGWGTIFGNGKLVRYDSRLPNGILIEKSIAPGSAEKLQPSISRGRKVAAWCEEGLIYSSRDEYVARKIDPNAYDLLDTFFCWGRHQAADVKSAVNSSRAQIAITGNPRFDLHRPEYRKIFAQKAQLISKQLGSIILVNTRFSRFNGPFSGEQIVDKMVARGKLQTDRKIADAQDLIAFHKAGFDAFVGAVNTLSREFRSHTIVVRPHPFERQETWKENMRDLPNVLVTREGNVGEWLLAADVSIHTNCTTAVEANLLKRPVIAYRPILDERFDMFLPNALSLQAPDIATLVLLVRQVIEGGSASAARDDRDTAELIESYVANAEGAAACTRILDRLEEMDVSEAAYDITHAIAENVAARESPWARGLSMLRRAVAADRNQSVQTAPAAPDALARFLAEAKEATGRFEEVATVPLSGDTYCVYA